MSFTARMAAIAASAALVATGVTASVAGAATTGSASPPCTRHALFNGLRRGSARVPGGRIIKPYGCAHRFAFAAVITSGIEITTLFRADGTSWVTVRRGRYCRGRATAVPRVLRRPACLSN